MPAPEALGQAPRDIVTELIFDASGSMKGMVQQRTKLLQAKRAMKGYMIQSNAERLLTGLRVYGLKERDCKDSRLLYGFGDKGLDAIQDAIDRIDPKGYGKTPLAYSLEQAAKDLAKFGGRPTRIVVLTDGVDTCGGDPCKTAAEIGRRYDTRIYVIGYTLDDRDRARLKCMSDQAHGTFADANDLGSLTEALNKLDSPEAKNLFVESPDPLGVSDVFETRPDGGKRYVKQFVSKLGTHVEPGKEYEVIVRIQPNFTFHGVQLRAGETRTLVVQGSGVVTITFGEKLWDVSLLNAKGAEVAKFASDTATRVPAGSYKVKAVAAPFAETLIDDIQVNPGGEYKEPIRGFGAISIDADVARGPGPFGYYIFDTRKKQDIGSFLTGMPVVLPSGKYSVKSFGDSVIKNIVPESDRILHFKLPKPGETITIDGANAAPKPR